MCIPLRPSGLLLRAHRMNRGLTQAELAELAGMNVNYISALETGRNKGGVRGWKRLADALEVEVMDFIPRVEQAG